MVVSVSFAKLIVSTYGHLPRFQRIVRRVLCIIIAAHFSLSYLSVVLVELPFLPPSRHRKVLLPCLQASLLPLYCNAGTKNQNEFFFFSSLPRQCFAASLQTSRRVLCNGYFFCKNLRMQVCMTVAASFLKAISLKSFACFLICRWNLAS